ncbi:MAG: sigma-54-dependent Fis family transcriptional regulator [Elusimicrobia bacterium]|nr:sigma-54-dependent Fis family transcriptional regulator [Elusimicrobiota bacterium]
MALPLSVLIIDDEESLRDSCRQLLGRRGFSVKEAADGPSGLAEVRKHGFDLVLLDLRLPGMDGLEVLKRVKEGSPGSVVIMITGHATVASAVDAMKLGAYDVLPKPFTPGELMAIIGRAAERRRLETENIRLREELKGAASTELVAGPSRRMREVLELVGKVAPSEATVLLTGESGTGKELVARAIHRQSGRADGPFVAVDCGSIVPTLFESELFGHVRGAFTDAVSDKRGKIELANGGTLFLDEIGNIALEGQVKLLRALQEREIVAVGGTQSRPVDVRIVAATNRDLRQAVSAGAFRDDLFYRINVISLNLPPLRERREDLPDFVKHFIGKYSRKCKKGVSGISPEAMAVLQAYAWPGNVRELENVIERAVILAEGGRIGPKDLSSLAVPTAVGSAPAAPRPGATLADVERGHILAALEAHGGNKTQAAASLGISRKTLHLKLKAFGL